MKRRIFAIGDIHGCFDAFKQLLKRIVFTKNDQLILLGDYIDRGPQSKEVIDYIIELQQKGSDIIPLMGNHEQMLLEAIEDKSKLFNWIQNGGLATLNSFSIDSLDQLDQKYIDFFNCLQYYYSSNDILKDKVIIHAHRPIKIEDCKEAIHANKTVINVDTGCVYNHEDAYGALTAIEINTKAIDFVYA